MAIMAAAAVLSATRASRLMNVRPAVAPMQPAAGG
jgi:hypothetical protein